jgi:GNAT superfamily N-acetyltransferase
MEKVLIKFARLDDFKKIRLFDPHSKYIDPEKIKNSLIQKEVIIALFGKKIVGIIKFSYLWATRPYIGLIFVKKEFRKKGVGRKLLAFLEKFLVKEGYSYLFISSEEDEKKPQAWHKKMGFFKCGVLSSINLPQSASREVFFCKKIADKKKLRTYPVI